MFWGLGGFDSVSRVVGRGPTPTPVPPPTSTPAPTATSGTGISITIPGRDGTPTSLPITIPGITSSPSIPIPGLSGSPSVPIPGASGTPPPNAKLTADLAREKVKESLRSCRLLQVEIEASQVTFEPPDWLVTLPLSRATWRVNDETGAVTPDERAAERARNCRF